MTNYDILFLSGLALSLFSNIGLASATSRIWGNIRTKREFSHHGVTRAPHNVYETIEVDDFFYILWGLLFLAVLGGVVLLGRAMLPEWILINWKDLLVAAALMFVLGGSFLNYGTVIQKFAHAREGGPSSFGTLLLILGVAFLLAGGYCLWGAQSTMDVSISIFSRLFR
jgi:hypothetical protein